MPQLCHYTSGHGLTGVFEKSDRSGLPIFITSTTLRHHVLPGRL
jgi:hypothetical protein